MDYNLLAMHLNTDVDDKSVGTESYRDIRNMRPYKGRYETIEGNRLLVPTTRTVIGSVYDSVYECNYFLLKDVDDEHAILRVFRTGEYDYILDNQGVLNFKKEISHIDVIDGRWLSFTDGYDNGVNDYNPPRLIDIHMCDGFTNKIEQKPYKRGQARSRGELVYLCINDDTEATGDVNDNWKLLGRKYTTISSNHITRAKNEPYAPPSAELNMNINTTTSELIGDIYKFAYTYVYTNGTESKLSPYSKTIYPIGSTNKIPNYYFNEILLQFNTGDETVRTINLYVLTSKGIWGLFKSIDKKNNLGVKLVDDNITYEYVYNGNDSLIDVVDKTGFNAAPQSSTSSCFSSTGRIIDGNTTEFYDYENIDFDLLAYETYVEDDKLILCDPLPKYSWRGYPEYWPFPEYTGRNFIVFVDVNITWVEEEGSLPSGVPLEDVPIVGKYSASFVVNDNNLYPSAALDDIISKLNSDGCRLNAFAVNKDTLSRHDLHDTLAVEDMGWYNKTINVYYTYLDTANLTTGLTYDSSLSIGIAYYDEKGRTPGVFSVKEVKITSPNLVNENKLRSYTSKYNIRMTIKSDAPSWAKYWAVVASKNNPYYEQFFLNENPVFDEDYIKIKKTWEYQSGDRIIFRYELNRTIKEVDYLILDSKFNYPILKSDSEYIYISSVESLPYGLIDDNFNSHYRNILCEIRRKTKTSEKYLMTETDSFGTVVNKKHLYRGIIQSNSITFKVDYYNSFYQGAIFNINAPNFVSEYIYTSYIYMTSKPIDNDIYYLDGRPSYEDKTIRRTNFRNRLRWTGVYVPNGGVNKLNYNKFTDYIDLSNVHGSINHVGESNGIMSVKQNRKTTSIYVGKHGLTQAAGENYDLVVSSETVLGSRYESRTDIGCINPESYVKTSSGSYFFDKIGGRIVFDSQSGLQDISTGFINELIKGKQTIQSAYIGAPYYEVWFYLGNEIVVWSERDKKWIYRVDVSGIDHITNSDIILTCKDGIWVHDSSVRKLYKISINNKVSIQVSPVVRSTAKTLAVIASDSVDITLSDSARLTNTPHGLAKKKDDIWYYPIRRFGDVHNGSVPRFDTALLTLNKQSVLPMTIHQLSVKLI